MPIHEATLHPAACHFPLMQLAPSHAGLKLRCADSTACLQVGSRPIRPLSSVFLPRQQIDVLLADVERFRGSEAWYGESLQTEEILEPVNVSSGT